MIPRKSTPSLFVFFLLNIPLDFHAFRIICLHFKADNSELKCFSEYNLTGKKEVPFIILSLCINAA